MAQMREFGRIFFDVILVVLAGLCAELLLKDFATRIDELTAIGPYVAASGLSAAVVIPILRLSNTVWRYSTVADYSRIFMTVAITVSMALSIAFAFNRLEGVPRSLPILHGILTLFLLMGARDVLCWYRRTRNSRKTMPMQFAPIAQEAHQTVLLIGVTQMAEVYLQAFRTSPERRISVAGVLSRYQKHVGRLLHGHRILGRPEAIESVLLDLKTHGVSVDCIILTEPLEQLGAEARDALNRIRNEGRVELQFAHRDLLSASKVIAPVRHDARPATAEIEEELQERSLFTIPSDLATNLANRWYWPFKRSIDIALAATLIVILLPFYLIVGLLVAVDVGFPVLFWQRRLGLSGHNFKVYKFRTMGTARRADGTLRSDSERTSKLGQFIRNRRLDELPQLFSILWGDMSFIGPRPLLPVDQPEAVRSRLLIRPGLTGWAQVAGGRLLTPMDKAALDVWYIHNASLWLDIRIVLKTVWMVIWHGEHTNQMTITEAWKDLEQAGIVQPGAPFTETAIDSSKAAA